MAEMVSTTVAFPKWTLTTSALMDACAEELFTSHRMASESIRSWDHADTNIRSLQIHQPDSSAGTVTANLGEIVIFLNGAVEALTPDAYTARGYAG